MQNNMIQSVQHDISPSTAATIFWTFVILHSLVWIFLPYTVMATFRYDVILHLFIGKEWVWSTYDLPQLVCIMLEIAYRITGRADWSPYLVSQLCVVGCYWSIWQLGRQLLSEKTALLAVFSMGSFWYFTYESTQVNHGLVLMLTWNTAILALIYAFKTDRLQYWILTGVLLGLGIYAKYTTFLLVFFIVLYMIIDPVTRRLWLRCGPYVTTVITFIIFLPHLFWLIQTDFAPLEYVERKVVERNWLSHLKNPFKFFGEQIGYLVPMTLVLLPLLGFRWRLREMTDHEKRIRFFLFFMIIVPPLFLLALSFCFALKIDRNYGLQFWPFYTILLLYTFQLNETIQCYRRAWILSFIGMACMILVLVSYVIGEPYFTGKSSKTHYPNKELAELVEQRWNTYYSFPCPYLAGEWGLTGNATLQMKDRPAIHAFDTSSTFVTINPIGNWSTDAEVCRRGGIVLWNKDYYPNDIPRNLFDRFPSAIILEGKTLHYKTRANIPPLRVGIAILPPSVNIDPRK